MLRGKVGCHGLLPLGSEPSLSLYLAPELKPTHQTLGSESSDVRVLSQGRFLAQCQSTPFQSSLPAGWPLHPQSKHWDPGRVTISVSVGPDQVVSHRALGPVVLLVPSSELGAVLAMCSEASPLRSSEASHRVPPGATVCGAGSPWFYRPALEPRESERGRCSWREQVALVGTLQTICASQTLLSWPRSWIQGQCPPRVSFGVSAEVGSLGMQCPCWPPECSPEALSPRVWPPSPARPRCCGFAPWRAGVGSSGG